MLKKRGTLLWETRSLVLKNFWMSFLWLNCDGHFPGEPVRVSRFYWTCEFPVKKYSRRSLDFVENLLKTSIVHWKIRIARPCILWMTGWICGICISLVMMLKLMWACDQGRIQGWWTGGGRGRGAAGDEGVGFGEGCSHPQREGAGEGAVPPPQKFFFEFLSQNGTFLCILQSAAVILGSENAWRRGSMGFLS